MEEKTITAQSETLEIEQMHVQMAALKCKLDEQELINKQLIRHAMKSRLSWINSYVIVEVVVAPLLLLVFILIDIYVIPISPGLMVYTLFIVIGNVIYDWRMSWMKDSNLLQGDLKNLRKNLVAKKRRIMWENIVSLAAVAIWIAGIILTIYDHMFTLDPASFLYSAMKGSIIGVAIGCVVGIVGGLWTNRKIGQTYSEVIAQIDELLQLDNARMP